MKKFTLTKQLFAAALVVAMGFTGCQKSEMDEVSILSASNGQEVIIGACGATLGELTVGRRLDRDNIEGLGTVEVGNTATDLIVQFTSDQPIRQAKVSVNGIVYASDIYNYEDGKLLLQIVLLKPAGTSVFISNIEMKVGGHDGDNGFSAATSSNRVDGVGDYTETYTYQACAVTNCSWDKDYWKQNPDEWPANFSLMIQGTLREKSYLLQLLSTGNANDNIVKLTQAYTVAKLNAASGANLNEIMDNGKTLGQAIAEAEAYFRDPTPKLPAGIVGRLHQLPSCM